MTNTTRAPTRYELDCKAWHDDLMARRRAEAHRVAMARYRAYNAELERWHMTHCDNGYTNEDYMAGRADHLIDELIANPPDVALLSVPVTPIRGDYWQWLTKFVEDI